MKQLFLSALALGLITSAAAAESSQGADQPRHMSEAEMAQTVGGLVDIGVLVPVNVVTNAAIATAVGVLAKETKSSAPAVSGVEGMALLDQSSFDLGLD